MGYVGFQTPHAYLILVEKCFDSGFHQFLGAQWKAVDIINGERYLISEDGAKFSNGERYLISDDGV